MIEPVLPATQAQQTKSATGNAREHSHAKGHEFSATLASHKGKASHAAQDREIPPSPVQSDDGLLHALQLAEVEVDLPLALPEDSEPIQPEMKAAIPADEGQTPHAASELLIVLEPLRPQKDMGGLPNFRPTHDVKVGADRLAVKPENQVTQGMTPLSQKAAQSQASTALGASSSFANSTNTEAIGALDLVMQQINFGRNNSRTLPAAQQKNLAQAAQDKTVDGTSIRQSRSLVSGQNPAPVLEAISRTSPFEFAHGQVRHSAKSSVDMFTGTLLQPSAQHPSAAPPNFSASGSTPLSSVSLYQQEAWNQALGQQLVRLANVNNGQPSQVQIRLDPPDLGPLRVNLTVHDGVAHVVFNSSHLIVRQTLEQSLASLAQSFDDAGISLGQTYVGQDDSQAFSGFQTQSSERDETEFGIHLTSPQSTPVPESRERVARTPLGQIDTYA